VAFFSAATAVNAGPGAGPKDGAKAGAGKRMGGAMLKALNLTEAQKSRIKTIQTDAIKQRQTISSNAALSDDQKKSQMRTVMTSTMSKVMAVLTPEQKQTLQKEMMERMGKMTKVQAKKGSVPAAPKP
jgi:Spy/CpxP family protein refolding chaperone